MDLLLAVAVWAVGAWLAYRWGVRASTDVAPRSPDNEEPRRRQEGMDVRRRRGQG